MNKKELIDRKWECRKLNLCYISLKPLDLFEMVEHSEVGSVAVNTNYLPDKPDLELRVNIVTLIQREC